MPSLFRYFMLFLLSGTAPAFSEFQHPGGRYTVEQIMAAKELAHEGLFPWSAAYESLIAEAEQALQSPISTPPEILVVPQRYKDRAGHVKAANPLREDSRNSVSLALAARMTDDPESAAAYAEHAIKILMTWAQVKDMGSMDTNREAALVTCVSGNGFLVTADILYHHPAWNHANREAFLSWADDVMAKAAGIKTIKYNNNWNCWGTYTAMLVSQLTDDEEGLRENARILSHNINKQIEPDGKMPAELKRGRGATWYTYYALCGLTNAAVVLKNATGEDYLDTSTEEGKKLRSALDFFTTMKTSKYRSLMEGMGGIYHDSDYLRWNYSERPVVGMREHNAWNYPSLFLEPYAGMPVNQQPDARPRVSTARAKAGETVNFDGSDSKDEEGPIARYIWQFEGEPEVTDFEEPLYSLGDAIYFPEDQTGRFTISYDIVTGSEPVDAAIGLMASSKPHPHWKYSSFIVNTKGNKLLVLDGETYRADIPVMLEPDTRYRIDMMPDIQARTIDVDVTKDGETLPLARNYSIRTSAEEVDALNKLAYLGEDGIKIENIKLSSTGLLRRGPSFSYTFPQPGTYSVSLTAVDEAGDRDTAEIQVEVLP